MKRQNFRRIPRPELSASSKKALRGAVSTLNSPWAASLARAFASASALILCWVSSMSTSSSAGSFLPAATVGAWREGVAFNKVGVSKAIAVRYATINRYKLFKLPLQRWPPIQILLSTNLTSPMHSTRFYRCPNLDSFTSLFTSWSCCTSCAFDTWLCLHNKQLTMPRLFTWNGENVEQVVPHKQFHLSSLLGSLAFFIGDFVPPQPVLVVAGKTVNHNGDGQG